MKTKMKTKAGRAAGEKKPPHRPRIKIDIEVLRGLAQIQCTEDEAASVLKVSKRTLIRRLQEDGSIYREIWEAGQAEGRVALRRLQFRHAKMPNSAGVQMTIHLSKHHLGQTDKAALELSGRVDSAVRIMSVRERVHGKLNTLAERITSRVAGIAAAAGADTVSREPV